MKERQDEEAKEEKKGSVRPLPAQVPLPGGEGGSEGVSRDN